MSDASELDIFIKFFEERRWLCENEIIDDLPGWDDGPVVLKFKRKRVLLKVKLEGSTMGVWSWTDDDYGTTGSVGIQIFSREMSDPEFFNELNKVLSKARRDRHDR